MWSPSAATGVSVSPSAAVRASAGPVQLQNKWGFPVCQHWHVCLPEAPVLLLPIPGSGGGSCVLSGASTSEAPHLQHEEPGAQGFHMGTGPMGVVSPKITCLPFFTDFILFILQEESTVFHCHKLPYI